MKPEHKKVIVEILQHSGLLVGMIGDGTNDSAAIKQSHVGMSFANADAAFSAPFSVVGSDSIEVVQEVLIEGRAALQTIV